MVDKDINWSFKQPTESTLGYNETVMCGHYSSTKLRKFAQKQAVEINARKRFAKYRWTPSKKYQATCHGWRYVFGRTAQDWIFLTLLGLIVAIFSLILDIIIDVCLEAHRWLYKQASVSIVAQYFTWVLFPMALICFSTGFTHLVGPTAIGSGIPEVKTILKGVILKEYLTLKTLIAKLIGLAASLGSGLPLGKLGPFVHVASITATLLTRIFPSFRNELENETLSIGILTAAAAVGVSCIFATPIGGVLFSIEATATYYAVKNYWRGFYAAMCGAITFRLLATMSKSEQTLTAVFKTNLRQEQSYDIFEFGIFICVGIICGLLGALFVFTHKNIVMFIRRQKRLSAFLQKTRFLYPCIVTLVIFSVLFPAGFGQYCAGHLSLREAVNQMFDNRTWSSADISDEQEQRLLDTWRGPLDNVFLTLFFFFIMRFWMCAIATTLPVPCGIFIPAFSLGAALGRLIGELMAAWFPGGIRGKLIIPGAYSIIGAATFSGAVSHTVSPAVIAFEMTGYLGHILPCLIGIVVAGATANFFQPSAYDAIIQIKKLPFLPPVINANACRAHVVTAEDMMVRDVLYLTTSSTFGEIMDLVSRSKFRSYPLVDNPESMTLVGSVQRKQLKEMLYEKLYSILDTKPYPPEETEVEKKPPPRPRLHSESRRYSVDFQQCRRLSRFSISKVSGDDLKHSQKSLAIHETQKYKQDINYLQDNCFEERLDLEKCIDRAPFQISCKTTLYKIHWLFSLLSLHHAFVTDNGRFAGIVSLKEVRKAILCDKPSDTLKVLSNENDVAKSTTPEEAEQLNTADEVKNK